MVPSCIVVLSPAKTLDMTPLPNFPRTLPLELKQSEVLVSVLKTKNVAQLKSLAGTSEAIAKMNHERFQNFAEQECKQAALAFDGPAYRGLRAKDFNKRQQEFAQRHLRILCGLYGVLRPFDDIQPFRLEMGSKLENVRGKNLYEFWGDSITEMIDKDLGAAEGDRLLINCASQEYWKAVRPKVLSPNTRIVTCEFPGPSVFAKRARGLMARFVIENEVSTADELKAFGGYAEDVYHFSAAQSSVNAFVFLRGGGGGETAKAKGGKGAVKAEESQEGGDGAGGGKKATKRKADEQNVEGEAKAGKKKK